MTFFKKKIQTYDEESTPEMREFLKNIDRANVPKKDNIKIVKDDTPTARKENKNVSKFLKRYGMTLEEYEKMLTIVSSLPKEFKKEGKLRFTQKIKSMIGNPKWMQVRMRLRNGDNEVFVIDAEKPYFIFSSGAYVIDQDCAEWNASAKMYELFYHEDIAFPFKFDIPVLDIKKRLEEEDNGNIDLSSNPFVLKKYIESEFVQKVAEGADIVKEFAFLKTMVIINLVVTVIVAIMQIAVMRGGK